MSVKFRYILFLSILLGACANKKNNADFNFSVSAREAGYHQQIDSENSELTGGPLFMGHYSTSQTLKDSGTVIINDRIAVRDTTIEPWEDSVYTEDLNFIYLESIRIDGIIFSDETNSDGIKISNSNFYSDFAISNAGYHDCSVSFINDFFKEKPCFYNAAREMNDTTDGVKMGLYNCNFNDGICFNSERLSKTKVTGNIFSKDLILNNDSIKGKLNLSYCSFLNNSSIQTNGNVFVDTIDMAHTSLSEITDLSLLRPFRNPYIYINLLGMDNNSMDKLKLQYHSVRLYFPDSIYNSDDKENIDMVERTYEALLANFEKNGLHESYEKLDIEYNNYKHRGWKFSFLDNPFQYYWNAYGYHRGWIFYWTFSVLGIFTIITFLYFGRLNNNVENGGTYRIDNIPTIDDINRLNAGFGKRLWFAFMYTATIYFHITLNLQNTNFKKYNLMYIIVIYTSGLIFIGYIANFVIQK